MMPDSFGNCLGCICLKRAPAIGATLDRAYINGFAAGLLIGRLNPSQIGQQLGWFCGEHGAFFAELVDTSAELNGCRAEQIYAALGVHPIELSERGEAPPS